MLKHILLVILFYTTMINAQISSNVIWLKNVEKAIKKATKEDKKTLLYFSGSDWCKPCIQLKENIFATDAFKTKAEKEYVLVNIDFILDRDSLKKERLTYIEKSAEKYNKYGIFPLVLILNNKGEIEKTIDGYKKESISYYIKNYLD